MSDIQDAGYFTSSYLRKMQRELTALDEANTVLSGREIYAYEVKLKSSLRALAGDPLNGFVVHTPNEVLEFLTKR